MNIIEKDTVDPTALFADLIGCLKAGEISLRDVVDRLRNDGKMRCNCDLDNWEPERSTGHSCVCRIHKTATGLKYRPHDFKVNKSIQP
jgi:hypothetical protein